MMIGMTTIAFWPSATFSVSPEKVWTQIYNLPGKPVSSVLLNENKPEVWLNAFPNPATQSLKVAYSLPQSINQGTLHLVDNTGRFVDQFIVDKHSDFLMLDVSRFQSGTYHYFIEYGNTKTPAQQLVIN